MWRLLPQISTKGSWTWAILKIGTRWPTILSLTLIFYQEVCNPKKLFLNRTRGHQQLSLVVLAVLSEGKQHSSLPRRTGLAETDGLTGQPSMLVRGTDPPGAMEQARLGWRDFFHVSKSLDLATFAASLSKIRSHSSDTFDYPIAARSLVSSTTLAAMQPSRPRTSGSDMSSLNISASITGTALSNIVARPTLCMLMAVHQLPVFRLSGASSIARIYTPSMFAECISAWTAVLRKPRKKRRRG